MITNTLTDIYNDFRSTFENTPDFVLDYYTKNSFFLNKISTFKDKDELGLYIELTWQYLNAIYQKGRFNETVDTTDSKLTLIDQEIKRLDADYIKNDWYYGLYLFKGMASYRMRDFKTATQIFSMLVRQDTQNENYKNWLNYSRYGQRIWLVNTVWIVAGLIMFMNIFWGDYIPNPTIRLLVSGLAFTALVINGIYEFTVKRSFRRTYKK